MQAIRAALASVSRQLGNTPAIARKSYVHPMVIESFSDGSLGEFLAQKLGEVGPGDEAEQDVEEIVLELLRNFEQGEPSSEVPARAA